MRFQLATLLTLTFITSLSLANPVPIDDDSFQALARDADDAALHAALHAKKEYKHGIFPHDRRALEAVRREHADEALRIVRFAVIRRQNSSNSSTTAVRHTTTEDTTTTTPTEDTTTTTPTEDTTTTTPPEDTTTTAPTERTTTTLPVSTTSVHTKTTTIEETSSSTVAPTPTSYTTTRTTTTTDSHGKPLTLTLTDVVVITPTRQPPKTTTGPPGLQPPNDAGRVELGLVQFGVAVVVGVAGMVL